MTERLSRREFLKLTSFGALGVAIGLSAEACGDGGKQTLFFTADERAAVEAAAVRILPGDATAGALEAGAVEYIDRLLSAFDFAPPLVFAGGPFSGRQPFPDNETGRPSTRRPENAFRRFLPLTRVKELGWRVRLFGSKSAPGGDFNDAVLGETIGWRDQYRSGITALDAKARELFSKPFVELAPEQQDEALTEADQTFVRTLVGHLMEGTFSAPEYGGNKERLGWQSVRFEGDSQPLGYSIFDASTDTFHERPESPLSTANPGERRDVFEGRVLELLTAISLGQGGKQFF